MGVRLTTLIQLLLIALLSGFSGCAKHTPPSLHTKDDTLVEVRLEEVDEGTTARAFGKIIRAADGVIDSKRYSASIVPGEPQKSYVVWRALTRYADPLRLEDSIMENLIMLLRNGGQVVINNIRFDYIPPEIEMLKGVRLIDASSNRLRYIVDRELARDRDFSGAYNPYNAQ